MKASVYAILVLIMILSIMGYYTLIKGYYEISIDRVDEKVSCERTGE